jgi:hypothetical protein
MLTDTYIPPVDDNFCDENCNATKPATVEGYNKHVGYVDRLKRMTKSYSQVSVIWDALSSTTPGGESIRWSNGGNYIHIKQITKKLCTLNFIVFKYLLFFNVTILLLDFMQHAKLKNTLKYEIQQFLHM